MHKTSFLLLKQQRRKNTNKEQNCKTIKHKFLLLLTTFSDKKASLTWSSEFLRIRRVFLSVTLLQSACSYSQVKEEGKTRPLNSLTQSADELCQGITGRRDVNFSVCHVCQSKSFWLFGDRALLHLCNEQTPLLSYTFAEMLTNGLL